MTDGGHGERKRRASLRSGLRRGWDRRQAEFVIRTLTRVLFFSGRCAKSRGLSLSGRGEFGASLRGDLSTSAAFAQGDGWGMSGATENWGRRLESGTD